MPMRGKHSGFYRLLFSYLPILFVISSILIISFFLFVVKLSQSETKGANEFLAHAVMQSVDQGLKSIDSTIMNEIESDKTLSSFFSGGRNTNPYYLNYEVGRKLNGWIEANPLMDSVYVVRWSDGLVITSNGLTELQSFADREFVEQEKAKRSSLYWTNARLDRMSSRVMVISLARKAPLLMGELGMVVVNVRTDAILHNIQENTAFQYGFLTIQANGGQPVLSTETRPALNETDTPKWQFAVMKSPYTGWEFVSGVKRGNSFSIASFFAYVWIGLALLVTILGSVWMVYITRKNYKPVEALMMRMRSQLVQSRSKRDKEGLDDLSFIGSTFEELIVELEEFQKQSERDINIRRKHLFLELMKGTDKDIANECEELLERNVPPSADSFLVTIAEIDRFHSFNAKYSISDQSLLRYLLTKVIQETAEQCSLCMRCEWITKHQLTLMISFEASNQKDPEKLVNAYWHQILQWIDVHLNFTVTVGVGTLVTQLQELPYSYRLAENVLHYKWLLENRKILRQEDLELKTGKNFFEFQHLVRAIVKSFRIGNDEWLSWFDKLFDEIRSSILAREEMVHLLNYLLFNLDKELTMLEIGVNNAWKEAALSSIREAIKRMESVTDAESNVRDILTELAAQLQSLREQDKNHETILHIKEFIEQDYHNPDLSLTSISDKFGMSGNYASKLFKETFGDTFVNYLIQVRMEKAKEYLVETSEPIQDISNNVGYIHTVSFNRVFKKVVGMTPGEFRMVKGNE
ncbi:hypothetical protein ASG89_01750 [Paenibacillus sp. Soil766]|uniref:helix-turn-helix domain-containing protein n=1 Tax=Paenibacillus sp. Soil766 TaxID=1736404 RepID=UPI0007112569|nr:helix-turn-helix domain-containing protein [Paenibacillus sp. Soil766]KRF10281.1 hypothetical protein ASG89_01750 [Paenibacillus sp. Soil766]